MEVRPNIIIILADDLGYGDLSCYGGNLKTVNIDQLAKTGFLMTDFHTNGAMCSPTRAAILTGMYQNRLGPHFESALNGRIHQEVGLPHDYLLMPEMFRIKGYRTALFGKWHLGYQSPNLPTDHGFERFTGLLSGDGDHHTHISRWGSLDWWNQDTLNLDSGYTTDLLTEASLKFIDENAQKPFFMFLSHLAIHFPWQGPDDPPHRVKGIDYKDDKWGIIPDRTNVRPHVEKMITSIDKSLGQIVAKLQENEIRENTIIVFTSDNGGYRTYESGGFKNISSNGIYRGQKTQVYEGGHRVPFIVNWPDKIEAGGVSSATAMTMDLLPTFSHMIHFQQTFPQPIDGIDLYEHFISNKPLPQRNLFWKMDDSYAIRQGSLKITYENDTLSLFNLESDPGEKENLIEEQPATVQMFKKLYQDWLNEVLPR
ncbi:MAG: sulfatase-like hydrolase/transferase [Saprospiraceae bacterium]|nr:sulfatase-like hydrolase/transferase [Saprospiraceae bacterium]